MQRALWPQGWPVMIGGQPVVCIARDEDEPYVAGDESSFVWRHAFRASTDRPADRETKKAQGVPGL